MKTAIYIGVALVALSVAAEAADDGDAETKALDSTATQWSFQLAYQQMPDYYDDIMDNGQQRPAGSDDYIQLRIVAPPPTQVLWSKSNRIPFFLRTTMY